MSSVAAPASTATTSSWTFNFDGIVGVFPAKIHNMNALKISFSSGDAEERCVEQVSGRGGAFCLPEETADGIVSTYFRSVRFMNGSYPQLLDLLAAAMKSDASIQKPFHVTREAFSKLTVAKPMGLSNR